MGAFFVATAAQTAHPAQEDTAQTGAGTGTGRKGRATLSTGLSVNHLITVLIALFGGWIWKVLGIETLFVLSAILGLCNSAYAATIKVNTTKNKEM